MGFFNTTACASYGWSKRRRTWTATGQSQGISSSSTAAMDVGGQGVLPPWVVWRNRWI